MPRYLTPQKICLLLLIDLYISDEVPNSSKLDVLSFVASQINAPSGNDIVSIEERFNLANADLAFFAEQFSQWQSGIPGRSLYDALLQRIWQLRNLDSLHNLFQQLGELVAPSESDGQEPTIPKISRSSPLGQYIRRSAVEFTRLQFADSQSLWNAFSAYRAPSHESWASHNPAEARWRSHDQPSWMIPKLSGANDPTNYISTADTDTLLSFSIYQLQKLGSRVPAPLKYALHQWLDTRSEGDSSAQSLQHFLAFFEYWRSGQYTMSLESLHRYFDYSLAKTSSAAEGGPSANGYGSVKVYYQYALLHLSVLHADFEAWGESVDAMEECIATARENQDQGCLNFALSWLLYLRQAHPDSAAGSFEHLAKLVGGGNGGRDEIAFLKTKAREGRVWSLLSSTLLEEAKGDMYSRGSCPKAFEHILQASYLDVQHDLRTLMPAATLFHGASLDRLGQSTLSDQIYASVTTLHTPHCPLNDRVRSTCRVAYNLAQGGRYDAAMQLLDSIEVEVRRILKLQQRVQAFKAMVQMKKYLRRGTLNPVRYYQDLLRPMRSIGDPEIQFEIALLDIDFDIREGEYETALWDINHHIKTLKSKPGSDVAQILHLLLQKSRAFIRPGRAPKAFSITLRVAAMAERYCLVSVLTEALATLAAILMQLEEFAAVREIVQAALPFALENRDKALRAELLLYLADSYIGLAGRNAPQDLRAVKFLDSAASNLAEAQRAYKCVEDVPGASDALMSHAELADKMFGEDSPASKGAWERYDRLKKEWEDYFESGEYGESGRWERVAALM